MSTARRALVTGAAGFVGRVMVPALASRGYEVVATSRVASDGIVALDVTDGEACRKVVAEARPDVVVHLAGMTFLPEVFDRPKDSFLANVLGTQNLLEGIRTAASRARTLLVSTCSVFGIPDPKDLPLKEDAPLRANHPYGAQKIGIEAIGEWYRAKHGLEVLIGRPFNHVGPGLNRRLSVAFFAGQIVAAERGETDPVLKVGNLEARRDFTDVRDVVRAYLDVLELETPLPLFHVASGRSIRIGDVLDALRSRSRVQLSVETDPERLRPIDVPDLVGDASLLHNACGWSPQIPLEDTWDRILAWIRGEPYGEDW